MAHSPEPVYRVLASAVQARLNCDQSGNTEWFHRWEERIGQIVADFLPSGSGWDNGTTLDEDPRKSNGERLTFTGAYHHMDESGGYDGWTDHTVTVRPSFSGIDVSISGRNRNEIKDYLAELFDSALSDLIVWDDATERYVRSPGMATIG